MRRTTSAGDAPPTRHVGRSSVAEPSIERLLLAADVTGSHERPRDERPGDGPPVGRRPLEECVHIDWGSQVAQQPDHLPRALEAILQLRLQERLQPRRTGVEEIPQHMDITAPEHGRDLYPGKKLESEPRRRLGGGGNASHRVVVGHAERSDPDLLGAFNERFGLQRPVRGRRVQVEIDHSVNSTRKLGAEGWRDGPTRRGPGRPQ